jgi:hypothetical protein
VHYNDRKRVFQGFRDLVWYAKNVKLHFGKRGLTYKEIIGIRRCNGLKVTDQP